MVNGVRHSLDQVALIAYYKLKKKCHGQCYFIHSCSVHITNCMGYRKPRCLVQCEHIYYSALFAGDHNLKQATQ